MLTYKFGIFDANISMFSPFKLISTHNCIFFTIKRTKSKYKTKSKKVPPLRVKVHFVFRVHSKGRAMKTGFASNLKVIRRLNVQK